MNEKSFALAAEPEVKITPESEQALSLSVTATARHQLSPKSRAVPASALSS
jgi:hypothetical protein